jgi:hypothetical protein
MTDLLQIHALLAQRSYHTQDEWNLERAQILPAAKPFFHIHLDLQMGPIFITIG